MLSARTTFEEVFRAFGNDMPAEGRSCPDGDAAHGGRQQVLGHGRDGHGSG
jgi:hypothetical protein